MGTGLRVRFSINSTDRFLCSYGTLIRPHKLGEDPDIWEIKTDEGRIIRRNIKYVVCLNEVKEYKIYNAVIVQ